MSHRIRVIGIAPAVALALCLALTGCGKLDAGPAGTVDGSSGAGSPSTSAGATSRAPASALDDTATLDGIRQDLDSASAANTEAGSSAQAGDQAAATSDEP